MRTSLKYSVFRQNVWDDKKGKEVSIIVGRDYIFTVSGADSEASHSKVIDSFEEYLKDNGYSSDRFANGSWEDNVAFGDTKDYLYLIIPVADMDAKDEISAIYKEWKNSK